MSGLKTITVTDRTSNKEEHEEVKVLVPLLSFFTNEPMEYDYKRKDKLYRILVQF
jgi:hypothetical protein